MVWAGNYWLFCDNRQTDIYLYCECMNEGLLDLDMEPMPESLWWTRTLRVVVEVESGIYVFVKFLKSWDTIIRGRTHHVQGHGKMVALYKHLPLEDSSCKDNTSKNPFSQCEQRQGITRNSHAGEKVNTREH